MFCIENIKIYTYKGDIRDAPIYTHGKKKTFWKR